MAISAADVNANFFVLRLFPKDRPQSIITSPNSSIPSFIAPQIPLLGKIAFGWSIIQLLLVTLEQDEDGDYIISDEEFLVYGDGSTPGDAMDDYIVSLIDYYQLLAMRANDDTAAASLFHRLQSYLKPIIQDAV